MTNSTADHDGDGQSSSDADSDVAIVHGHLTSDGGAERVAIEAARVLNAPIYALRADDEYVPDDVDARQVVNGRVGRWFHERDGPLPETAFWLGKHLHTSVRASWIPELQDYDVVLATKSEGRWYQPAGHQTLIQYQHTPSREHYSHFAESASSPIRRIWSTIMRTLHAGRPEPHKVICNSELTAQRERIANGTADDRLEIIHPPVATTALDPSLEPGDAGGRYYLLLGRLEGAKAPLEVVETVADRDDQLIVAGAGGLLDDVQDVAADEPNIRAEGYVDEQRKRELLAGAAATIHNAKAEDFGIVPIESMAAGTPVIGVEEGFTELQIFEGRNGRLYDRGRLDHVLDRFDRDGVAWSADQLATWADTWFSRGRFRRELVDELEAARAASRIEPPWSEESEPEPAIERPAVADGGTDDGA